MRENFSEYYEFEELLSNAFELERKKEISWPNSGKYGRVGSEAEEIFGKRNWREMVGFKLITLDCSFPHNLEWFPVDAAAYYLPAFLMRAALELYDESESEFPLDIAEGLLLPLSDNLSAEIDEALSPYGSVSQFPNGRVSLYKSLNSEQRRCVAAYLTLFWKGYEGGRDAVMTKRAGELFQAIVKAWQESSF